MNKNAAVSNAHNKALVRMQTTLRFVCTTQLGRWGESELIKI